MRRTFDIVVAVLGAMTAAALLAVILPAYAQVRELTPADMRVDTPCYKSGTGRNPRTQAIVQAQVHAQRVGADGYWQLCEEHAEHARQVADITRGTACGMPGVGIHPVTGVIYAATNPHEFVTADGVWQRCETVYVAPKPPAAADGRCALPEVLRWAAATEPGAYAPSDAQECNVKAGGVLRPGQSRAFTSYGVGEHQGTILMSCTASGLTVALANCSRAQVCIASAYRASDDGGNTWWTFQGRLAEGATGKATGPDGKTRPVQCVGGRLRLM